MESRDSVADNPEKLIATISRAYLEVLSGVRRPEQLARWLTEKAYKNLCEKAKKETTSRIVSGVVNRQTIVVRQSKMFLTIADGYQGVVLVKISGATKAVSVRAKRIHDRFRVTELELI